MKIVSVIIFLLIFSFSQKGFSQGAPPWERPLRICYSNNGINFTPPVVFQDSSGVPSVTLDSTGRLVAAFQWFPAPMNGPHWDSVAVKFSIDSGLTWTGPQSIVVQNLPLNFQRPFDPTLVTLPTGQIRIYFSSGPPGPNSISTHSAIGTDGIHYLFEPGARFTQSGRNVIDPAVTLLRDTFHFTSPKGAPQDGAFHASSTDGLNFTQLADIVSDSSHQWTGNLMIDSLAMKFYGTGARGTTIWLRSTSNGNVWSPYVATNIAGGDPAVVKIRRRPFVMIFTGEPVLTAVSEIKIRNNFDVYPNPTSELLNVVFHQLSLNVQLKIFDLTGREMGWKKSKMDSGTWGQKISLDLSEFSDGLYFLLVQNDGITSIQKIVVAR